MDIQSIWVIIVPIVVSIFAWLLTYIIPFIFPYQVTWLMLLFTSGMDPKDPIGIKILVNQFMKYADWKRLTAMQRLKRIFKKKAKEIAKADNEKWLKYDKHLICMSLNEFMDDLGIYLASLRESEETKEIEEIIPEGFELKKENIRYTRLKKPGMSANLRGDKLKIWYYSDNENPINYKKIVKELINYKYESRGLNSGFNMPFIDYDGKLKKDEVIIRKLGGVDFIHMDKEDIDQIFDKIIIFLDDPREKEVKEVLLHKFAYGLSNSENSADTLKRIIRDNNFKFGY